MALGGTLRAHSDGHGLLRQIPRRYDFRWLPVGVSSTPCVPEGHAFLRGMPPREQRCTNQRSSVRAFCDATTSVEEPVFDCLQRLAAANILIKSLLTSGPR